MDAIDVRTGFRLGRKLGKGESFFICKYTVTVVGSTAAPLDPVIIIEK